MRKQLLRFQLCPCKQTLGNLIVATEAIRRHAARRVAMRIGRVRDGNFIDVLVAESAYRVFRMADALRRLPVATDAQFKSYVTKLARGAALDAADEPLFGASRRNLKRRVTAEEPSQRVDWPDESFGGWPGKESPRWSDHADRGDEWHCLVDWVATTAKAVATAEEKLAINQVIKEMTDAEMARLLGMAKSTWQLRRAELLPRLAPRIVAAADHKVDSIGEKYLGIAWILSASEAEPAVLLEEGQRDAA